MTFWQHRGGTPFRAQKQSISKPPPPYAREKVKSWLLRRGSDFDVARNLEKAKKRWKKRKQKQKHGKSCKKRWKKRKNAKMRTNVKNWWKGLKINPNNRPDCNIRNKITTALPPPSGGPKGGPGQTFGLLFCCYVYAYCFCFVLRLKSPSITIWG